MSTIPTPLTAREIEMFTGAEPTAWWPSTTSGGTGVMYGGGASGGKSILGSLSTISTTMLRDKIIRELVDDGYWVKMTGSRVTKDGWTDESDWDYVVYDPDKKFANSLRIEEWVVGSLVDAGEFMSIRKGDVNLILVDKEEVWKKYIIATNLIKTLNSKTKGERIAVFDSVFGKDKNAAAVDFGVPF
jgi:predicted nucleotidyltransferase